MSYSISKISEIIKAKLIGERNCEIKHLLIDSRNVISASDSLFFAIRGERHDGHNFVDDLHEKGVFNFVVEELPQNYLSYAECNFLVVRNSLQALQDLASYHRSKFNYQVIGITGSHGKTIIKEWIFHILHNEKNIVRNPKSYNSQVGVPLSVWLMDELNNLAVFEAGISIPGEMEKLERIIRPSIGLISNIGEPHQENFSSYEQKAEEKMNLFKNTDVLVYSKDQEIIDKLVKKDSLLSKKKLFVWSEKKDADLRIVSRNIQKKNTIIKFEHKGVIDEIDIPYIDKASVENAIHALAVVLVMNIKPENYKEKFASLPPVAMRLELKKGINGCTIINDSYNSDLNSLSVALNYLALQSQHSKKTLIISDILQSGKSEKELYQEVSTLVNKFKIDQIIGIGESINNQSKLFDIEKYFYLNTEDFLSDLMKRSFSNEAILLKGSRNFLFENISKALEEKAHRTILEINLNALVHNMNFFKSKLKPGTRIMAMVKALSYGSGTYEIANALQYQGVDYLGVAFADEGVLLREAGIKTPIIVMNPEQESFDTMLEHKLEPEIYNFKILHQFDLALSKLKKRNYSVHIKIDTGMHRLGFLQSEVSKLIQELKARPQLKVSSVFSHLAASENQDHDQFTRSQLELFNDLSDEIIKGIGYPVIRHISNSAGIERFSEAQYDMVRLGIGLYGISAVNQNNLVTVSTLKSMVIQVKQVSADETIGYNRKGVAQKDMSIAIVPIGYADGLNRKLGNGRGKLYIKGFYVPIVGDVCMDMCMVDITCCNIHEGDEVIVFGKEQSVVELANTLETIPYEIFTSVSSRVKRVYFQE